ncbi:MAG: glycosyl transferase, partial [Muribaculaceae bacterium]|nr:glycosyl transferase [Muribaculaceae bacterium]
MKILQINANYGYGSTGVIMKDIHELISGQPDMESWVAFQRTNQDIPQGIRIGNNFDWKLHALLTRIAGRQGFYSSVPTIRFLRKLDKLKPDIVHLHNLHSNFINISLLLEFLAERK